MVEELHQQKIDEVNSITECDQALFVESTLNQAVMENMLMLILHELRILADERASHRQLVQRAQLNEIYDFDRKLRTLLNLRIQQHLSGQQSLDADQDQPA